MTNSPHEFSIAEAAALIAGKQLSPVELTESHLSRITDLDPKLHAFLTVTPEIARAEARAAEERTMRGRALGPLDGIPMAFKDLYATKNVRTTAHSQAFKDWTPDFDATAVARLRASGAVLLGKLGMHELATGGPAFDSPWPPPRNPWNTDYIPGGSSSGSAVALAARLCMGALGSDTGGSIRGPASLCGVVGLMPTYGRVSRYGVMPLAWSMDHVGPMARTVEDCALMLRCIAGHDPKDPTSASAPVADYTESLKAGVRGLRLGVPRDFFMKPGETNPETLVAVEDALGVLQDLGATVVEVAWPALVLSRVAGLISAVEAYTYYEKRLKAAPEAFGRAARLRLRLGAILCGSDYVAAQRARAVIRAQAAQILSKVDVLVTPTSPAPAVTFEAFDPMAEYYSRPNYTRPFNLTGQPAVSVPCGFSSRGLPIGLQIAGRPFDEVTVLRVASAYEQATDWHTRTPAL